MPLVCCECGEKKRVYVTENLGELIGMMEWLIDHWERHKIIYSETDLLTTFTVKTPVPMEKRESSEEKEIGL